MSAWIQGQGLHRAGVLRAEGLPGRLGVSQLGERLRVHRQHHVRGPPSAPAVQLPRQLHRCRRVQLDRTRIPNSLVGHGSVCQTLERPIRDLHQPQRGRGADQSIRRRILETVSTYLNNIIF